MFKRPNNPSDKHTVTVTLVKYSPTGNVDQRYRETYQFDTDIITIGRISDRDIQVEQPMSREHAHLDLKEDEHIYYVDEKSSNGSTVLQWNGKTPMVEYVTGDIVEVGQQFQLIVKPTGKAPQCLLWFDISPKSPE